MKLDLSKYHKLHSDHEKTVMQHPKGHTIHVDHADLSDHARKALHAMPFHPQKLAEGGPVKPPPPQLPGTDEERKKVQDGFNKALGFADGGEVPLAQELGQKTREVGGQVAEGLGSIVHTLHQYNPLEAGARALGQFGQGLGLQTPSNIDDVAPGSTQAGSLIPNPPPLPSQAPINDLNANNDQFGTKVYSDTLGKGMANAELGLKQQYKADLAASQAGAQANQEAAKALQSNTDHYQTQLKELDEETKHFVNDVHEGHIDPNRYMGSLSTAGKISTVLGLLIGGAPAAHFVEKIVDNDIKAQEKELDNKQTLLKANLQRYGNLRDAADATRLQLMAKVGYDIQSKAELAKTPQAQANLTKGLAELQMKMAPLQQELAARRSLLSGQGENNPSLAVRFLPGDDSTKKGALKEIADQENLQTVAKGSLEAFDRVGKLQGPVNRIFSPIQSAHQIDAIWGPMMDTITKQRAGRVTPQTVELFGQTKPSPLDTDETRKAKKKAFERLLVEGEQSTPNLDALGIKVKKKMQESKDTIPTIKRK